MIEGHQLLVCHRLKIDWRFDVFCGCAIWWLSTLYLFGPWVSLQWNLMICLIVQCDQLKPWEWLRWKQLSTTSKLESFHVSCDFDEATFRYLKISKLECRVQDIDWEPWVWMQLFKLGRKLEWRNILPWSDCYHFNTMIFHWEKSNELNWVMQHSWIFLKKLNTYNKVKQFTHKLVLSQKHSSNSINDL